jgi:hypothetical protein
MTKITGSISQRHGSADPDPPQNVMDPQHWFRVLYRKRQKVCNRLFFGPSPIPPYGWESQALQASQRKERVRHSYTDRDSRCDGGGG